ncbi:MAG: spore coat protein [Brockia lithotrophica]|nr:spore coat protein [Brockia lithotrophica]
MSPQTLQPPGAQAIPETTAMSDYDLARDALAMEKYIVSGLNIAAGEATSEQLHNDLVHMLTETHGANRKLFEYLFAKGWYPVEAEDQPKLDQIYQMFAQAKGKQMPH